ncbi:MAG: Co2+/Mg2+ efflux protein ApaG [Pontibacterium sp.]
MANTTDISPIAIAVETAYVPERSDPKNMRYVFDYHISITNHTDDVVTLRSRFWKIVDGNEGVQEVFGDGVVGVQPKLGPNQAFEYSSGAILATSVGSMQGHFVMERNDGSQFNAPISPFTLAAPNALH